MFFKKLIAPALFALTVSCACVNNTNSFFTNYIIGQVVTPQSLGTAFPVKNIIVEEKLEEKQGAPTRDVKLGVTLREYTFWLTCAHVVLSNDKVIIAVNEGCKEVELIEATVVNLDRNKDIALLKTEGYYKAQEIETKTPKLGTEVVVFGGPIGIRILMGNGIVSGFWDKGRFSTDAHAAPGSSGGPVFDKHTRKILGMTQAVIAYGGQLITFIHIALPGKIINDWLKEVS